MDSIIKKVLKKIENNGFEAYVVGGHVRDLILGKKSYDIDICTNALPKELIKIFPYAISHNYGGITFKIKKYNFDVTTYRKELKYKDRKPVELEYINNLFDDIMRRDFKMNTLCMNSKGHIIDLLDGFADIQNHKISVVGNCDTKFIEDPLRMLRAVRFMTVLDFEMDLEIKKCIESNKSLISTLSINRIKEELDKIMVSKNVIKGLKTLKELGILEVLDINFNDLKYVSDPLGMWAQLDMKFNSAFTKEEKTTIINIRKILNTKNIDKMILFEYGLYQSLVAGEILGINRLSINKLYKQLPIYNKKEIAITAEELIKLLNVEPGEIISKIIYDITIEIINKRLKNNNHDIKLFILSKKAMWFK